MMTITAEEAFLAYEAVRHRLPTAVPTGRQIRRVESLAVIADEFDVFLLDAFGVLNIGETAIPGTRERIDALRDAGKRILVVSNAASVPPSRLLEKYRRLGYLFTPDDIVTSRATLASSMAGMAEIRWGVMGGAQATLTDLGDLEVSLLGDESSSYSNVDGFLMIGSDDWTEGRQTLLEDALHANPRPVLVANPDIVAPREGGFSAEPGHFAHRLADRTGVVPRFFGKPFSNIFDLVFKRLGEVDKARVLMVGDSLHTDILGAQSAGVASALVALYGFFAGQDVQRAIDRAGIEPDFVVDHP